MREEIAERAIAGHLLAGRPDQAIGFEMNRPEKDIVGERRVSQSADLMTDIGEEEEAPPVIAEIDPDIPGWLMIN